MSIDSVMDPAGEVDEPVRARALYDLARFLPLMSWSGNASLLGIAAAVFTSGIQSIHWSLAFMAIFVAVTLQYVAHPINDLTDYLVDVRANIDGTGRRKVLISGLATEKELRYLSWGLLLLAAGIASYIIWFRPFALLFGAVGFFSVWAYNVPPLKLSYHPFSEFLIGFPANIAMVVGISYVATGTITTFPLILGVVQAFMASSMLISYFAMDVQSDYLGGKYSTIVSYPGIRWCTIYPLLGVGIFSLSSILGWRELALVLPIMLLGGMTILGSRIDAIWMGYLRKHHQSLKKYLSERDTRVQSTPQLSHAALDAWHTASGSIRLFLVDQMYLTILNGTGLFVLIVAGIRG